LERGISIIKNVIFDIGGVLLEYNPMDYLRKHYDADKTDLFMKGVYNSREWLDADRGLIDFNDLYDIFVDKLPEWQDDIKKLISRESLLGILTPKQDSIDFMYELKTAGYKVFLLSNFSKTGFGWMDEAYPFLKDVDGRIISSYVNLIKPDPAIYKLLFARYAIEPAESVFFDDMAANVEAAGQLGVKAVLFTDIESCRRQFKQMIKDF